MARIIVLDGQPVGLACDRRGKNDDVERFALWRIQAMTNGLLIVLPEIVDYEVRRELIRSGKKRSVERLDALRRELHYSPITTEAMRKAAELWADARGMGHATADDKALDADVILAAQALQFSGHGDAITVATTNVAHLSRYLDAQEWQKISPR